MKCHSDADGARLSREIRVMYLGAFSRTIDLYGVEDRTPSEGESSAGADTLFQSLSIFWLSTDGGR